MDQCSDKYMISTDSNFTNSILDFSVFLMLCVLRLVFQIWDLADPDGKGYLDKQVGNTSLLKNRSGRTVGPLQLFSLAKRYLMTNDAKVKL